jgi:hypothetical protein
MWQCQTNRPCRSNFAFIRVISPGNAMTVSFVPVSHGSGPRRLPAASLGLEVEQARYDARLAARRYERVDPDMRLVAAELEARWNAALERVRELESRLAAFDARGAQQHPIDERALHAVARDLPALWHDPSTDMRLKQRIVRILIREIIADVDDDARVIVLVSTGGVVAIRRYASRDPRAVGQNDAPMPTPSRSCGAWLAAGTMTPSLPNSICSAGGREPGITGLGCGCASCAAGSICPRVIRHSQPGSRPKARPST